MAPCTNDGLTHETASDGCIRLGNLKFTNINRLTSTFTSNPGQVLYPRDLNPTVHGGITLGTAPGGHILEFAHAGGPVPTFTFGPS
jgi:hypothetical protein